MLTTLQQRFASSLPRYPYCTDVPSDGVYRKPKWEALQHRLIQPNHQSLIRWLPFDIDADDGYFRPDEAGLPEPAFYAFNMDNGHCHILYELEDPVSKTANSGASPLSFLVDVQRGMCRRLGADRNYSGNLCKNVAHDHWEVFATGASPISLPRVNESLDAADKVPWSTKELDGFGRNCDLFNEIRHIAYRHVATFKRDHKTESQFRRFLDGMAFQINMAFPTPLFLTEVGGVTKSVSKWVWSRFQTGRVSAQFSAIQRARARKRWGVNTLAATKPWAAEGISRATWYRQHPKTSIS